jgi:hypothetical protein
MNEQVDQLNVERDAWVESETGYPEPTVITVDENTDFSKIHEKAVPLDGSSKKVRRVMIGIKMFNGELDFQTWQKEEPREIFEITPTIVHREGNLSPIPVIFVTYAAGIIE